MYSKIKIAGIVLISSILIYRCSAALLVPTAADAQKTGTPLNTLVQGREMYIGHCGSCHNLYLPETHRFRMEQGGQFNAKESKD